jgi:hypothetical protein
MLLGDGPPLRERLLFRGVSIDRLNRDSVIDIG